MKYLAPLLSLMLAFSANAQLTRLQVTVGVDSSYLQLGQLTVHNAQDTALIKGTYLDSTTSSLFFKGNQGEDYLAKIAIPSYKDTLIAFKLNDTLVDLGLVQMVKDKNLDQVDVVFKKEMFKRTMDGINVNVEGTSLQNLTNLFEVLKASPKITSPDNERIEIIGRGSPLILVDRQAIISNDELKAIPADQIERIEIITNPSAKYRAQGSGSGVIEVYTKSFHLEGYNMTIRSQAGIDTQMQPNAGINLGLSLKKKKFSLNGYFGGNYNESIGFGDADGQTTDDSNRSYISENENNTNSTWQYYSVKAAYNVSEKQKFTMGINGYGSTGNQTSTSSSTYATDGVDEIRENSIGSSQWTWLNNSGFINYQIETDTNKSNLELNLNYTNKVSNSDAFSENLYQDIASAFERNFDVRNDSRDIPNVGEFRINYEKIFDTTGWKLNIGSSYSLLINNKKFDRYDLVDGEWVISPSFSNSYDYQEHIGAAYVEVQKKWKKLGIRAGVRTEYTGLDGYSNSLEQQFMDSSFILPFPTASIMYEVNQKTSFTLSYKSGISRPQFDNFDPFVRVTDSLNVDYGNPFLRPMIEQSLTLDFDFNYMYSISLSYNNYRDPISSISFVDESTFVIESTPMNADLEQGVSASLNIPFKLSWLSGWNSIWVNYSQYTFTPIFGRDPFNNLTYGAYSYLTFDLPKDFSIMNRLHVNRWGGDSFQNNAVVNWGVRVTKKFKGNNIQLFGDVGNIIPPKYKSTNISGNYIYNSTFQNEFTSFKLGFFIKFGRLKANTNIEETKSGQSDRI